MTALILKLDRALGFAKQTVHYFCRLVKGAGNSNDLLAPPRRLRPPPPPRRPPRRPPGSCVPPGGPRQPAGAARSQAARGAAHCGWGWTGDSGWVKVAPQGCPGGTAARRATWEGWRSVAGSDESHADCHVSSLLLSAYVRHSAIHRVTLGCQRSFMVPRSSATGP